MSNIKEEFIEFIREELENREGDSEYGCELGFTLCEAINTDGSVTYSRQKAIDWIKENWYLCAESYDNQKSNWGPESLKNPFEEPEAFMVCVYIDIVNRILAETPTVSYNWDDKIHLTREKINSLMAEVEDTAENILGDF